ncbi:MAG: glucose dehydrogenase, partial [Meiothermus sp.]
SGHRLVAFQVNEKGIPGGQKVELVKNWVLSGGRLGAPVDVRPMGDRIYLTDDHNGMVLAFGKP